MDESCFLSAVSKADNALREERFPWYALSLPFLVVDPRNSGTKPRWCDKIMERYSCFPNPYLYEKFLIVSGIGWCVTPVPQRPGRVIKPLPQSWKKTRIMFANATSGISVKPRRISDLWPSICRKGGLRLRMFALPVQEGHWMCLREGPGPILLQRPVLVRYYNQTGWVQLLRG